jgi:uncharacterized membrane protein YeaQ/YmgE (transglycosylase-associated protein family)
MDGLVGLLVWIVIGAIAGWLASMVMHSRLGLIGDNVVGIIWALVGGFGFNLLGIAGTTGFNLWSIFVAFIGSVILLALVRLINGGRSYPV